MAARSKIPSDPEAFEEAVRAFRRLVPVTDDEWDAMTTAEREWAFHVAHVTQANVIQDVFDELDRSILDGTTFDDFKTAVFDKLAEAWGAPNTPRVETVFRTNVMRAYNEGRQAIMESEPVKKARPYWRFDAVVDNRTSDVCMERDGIVRPQDDPFWRNNSPPLHHNCRSILVPLTEDEADAEEGRHAPAPEVQPDGDFGRKRENPEDFEVDLDRFSPDLRRALEQRIGKKRVA